MAIHTLTEYLNTLLSLELDPIENNPKFWGLTFGRMGCNDGDGIEIWDTKLNRVFTTLWIQNKEFESLHWAQRWPYLWRRLSYHTAEAIFNRAL